MTIEEAAATLGLAPNEVTAAAVERNYREKVKHCHPDRANYPGATAEFKRTSEAFDRLRNVPGGQRPKQSHTGSRNLEDAIKHFQFIISFSRAELWASLTCWEKARSLLGLNLRSLELPFASQNTPLLMRSFDASGKGTAKPVLIAPVDVHVLDFDQSDEHYMVLLAPVEKDCLREHLEQSLARGLALDEACQQLTEDLNNASRVPLATAWTGQRRTA